MDRFRILEDLFESEAWFHEAKRKVIDTYMEAYDHCCDLTSKRHLAQTVCCDSISRPLAALDVFSLFCIF